MILSLNQYFFYFDIIILILHSQFHFLPMITYYKDYQEFFIYHLIFQFQKTSYYCVYVWIINHCVSKNFYEMLLFLKVFEIVLII